MELDKSMLYVETAEGKDIELLYQLCKKQSYEEFCLWGADFVYDYPPNLAQMKQSYASRKRMLLYRVIFQERIIGFAELDQIRRTDRTQFWPGWCWSLKCGAGGLEHSP